MLMYVYDILKPDSYINLDWHTSRSLGSQCSNKCITGKQSHSCT